MTQETYAFDADDVLLEGVQYMTQCAKEALPHKDIAILKRDFDLKIRFGISKEESNQVWSVWRKNLPHQLPFEGVAQAIRKIRKRKKIAIVTAIPPELMQARVECFKYHGIEWDEFYPTGFSGGKRKTLEALRPQKFFDDRLTNMRDAQGLGIHRVWVEHPEEIQCIEHQAHYYEERVASILDHINRHY